MRGGARENSGRKQLGVVQICIKLKKETVEQIDQICKEQNLNRRELIEKLLKNI